MACIKHYTNRNHEQHYGEGQRRSVFVEQHLEYLNARRRERRDIADSLYSKTLRQIVNERAVPGLPLFNDNYKRMRYEEKQRFLDQPFGAFYAGLQRTLKAKKRKLLYHAIVSHFVKTVLKYYYTEFKALREEARLLGDKGEL